MPQRVPLSSQFATLVLALFLGVAVLTMASTVLAQSGSDGPVLAKDDPAVKQTQVQMLWDEVRQERAEARARARHGKTRARRGDRAEEQVFDEDIAAGRLVPGARAPHAGAQSTLAVPTNVQMNSKAADAAGAGQAEEAVAIVGAYGLAAWNNGQGFNAPAGDVQATYYTVDGGATWLRTPGTSGFGVPPHYVGSPARTWTSDPVVTVNEKTGDFWYCGLMANTASTNGVGVVRGTFSGTTFTWDTPRIVASYTSTAAAADKQWMAADSVTGNVYVVWTRFDATDHIMFSRSTNNGLTWSPEAEISSVADRGLVQGARVVVGPNGEVYVVWSTLGAIDADFIKFRKSTDGGVSFGAEVVPASEYSNFGTGAPGFNRNRGITFPTIAVDRSTGPFRGRVYIAFEDCVNWYDDPLGGGGPQSEIEVNDTPGAATAFVPGQKIRGTIATLTDLDYWSFSATQGASYIFWCDSLPSTLAYTMRVFCSDGTTRLAFSGALTSGTGRQGFIVWTAPTTATYYLRMASNSTVAATGIGNYRIETGIDSPSGPPERARDLRDAFVTTSDNGTAWSTPVLASDDQPYYDNYLPEVGVGCDGNPYVMWYDWRDAVANCGGISHIYASRSTNGGASYVASQRISTAQTNWTTAASNIAPNQGDYQAIYGGKVIAMAWGDGRLGDADVWGTNFRCGPDITCPADSTVLANSTYTPWWNLINPNIVFDDTYQFNITCNRSWPGLPFGSPAFIPAGTAVGIAPSISIPDTAATGDVTLCFSASANGACVSRCCVTLHVLNPVTATLASLIDATAGVDGVKLSWEVQTMAPVAVYRSSDRTSWLRIGTVTPDGTRRVTFTDASAARGQSYGYRLGVPQGGSEIMAGETWVVVPMSAEFALHGARPNPTSGPMSVAFSLADESSARLELVDLVGRRVFSREVGSLGAGYHVLNLDRSQLPIGMYAIRLTQHGKTLNAKVSVIR